MQKCLMICVLLVLVVLPSCRTAINMAAVEKNRGRIYGSDFPREDATQEIERITRSVKKIYSVSSYTTYQFKKEDRITGYHLHQDIYKKSAWGVISTDETVFGSGTILGSGGSKVVLLTCAHVVVAPDTLISYFEPTGEDPSRYIQSISIKEKQENWVKDLASCGPFTVLAADGTADIALLGRNCEHLTDTIMPFPCAAGEAGKIGWGSFVYIFGYPLGNQVVTHGIASPASRRPNGEFFIDALLNKGYSGGIIAAHYSGVPGFELAGMVKTVNSTREEFLKPSSGQQRRPDWLPYEGDIFVGKSDNIQYGLNLVVPIDEIREFYRQNRQTILDSGYNLDGFFMPAKN